MTPQKVVVDTDVILEHLTMAVSEGRGRKSVLRSAMSKFFCYTTVFNVIELFGLCENEKQSHAVESALGALKILGLNGKSGRAVGSVIHRTRTRGLRDFDALIGGICVESRLPLLTGRAKNFHGIKTLRVMRASEFSRTRSSGKNTSRRV
jgi:predicted nucleic acid-binding protein